KKANQWERWRTVTIPELITPYMNYLARARSQTSGQVAASCTCGGPNLKTLKTLIVYIDQTQVHVCGCTSAANFLVSRGFFPCAPQEPSVAFDINMMELVATLFLKVAPNVTAWASTLETFLGARHFKMRTRYSVRRRLGNALNWYTHLINCVKSQVDAIIDTARLTNTSSSSSARPDAPPQDRSGNAPPSTSEDPKTSYPTSGGKPSSYLRLRCPLCFGGPATGSERESKEYDVIVCVDACFSQKRRAGPRDPTKSHPDTMFMSEAEVKAMEEYVSERRSQTDSPQNKSGTQGKKRAAPNARPDDNAMVEPDKCEGPLQVPNSVLDGCEASFKAADEQREKASTTFFDDTGLVALICRHDCVLWMINMTSAGERQHYALALIDKLFQHIPTTWHAGVLYDIGCQIHRSVYKWDFLCNIRDRITFAISVFHAYGHQWVCQLCYHPRKCDGFGFSDGEGAERFWSALDHLIRILRGSGYFQRLYLLDCQAHHIILKHLLNLAVWLARRHDTCRIRLIEAEKDLRECGVDEDSLRAEWINQRDAQTKPMPRQSKNAGAKYVEAIMALEERIRNLDIAITAADANPMDGDAFQSLDCQTVLEDDRTNARRRLAKLEGFLDEPSRQNLDALRKDKFLGRKANALALKTRLRNRLQQRKFEFGRIEQLRHGHSSERKLQGHVANAIAKRESSITTVVRKYNALCSEMTAMIRKGEAPRGAVAPTPIDVSTVWTLDVDDPIWQDTGLLDDEKCDSSAPRWLADNSVRKGIRAMLERDRCQEEMARIYKERATMQFWIREEWAAVEKAREAVGKLESPGMVYQIQIRRERLLHLAVVWRRRAGHIPPAQPQPDSWGPTNDELIAAMQYEYMESTADQPLLPGQLGHTSSIDESDDED
ncbi:hypothetical protein PUNSTDRAFT_32083, partial [Punctularia strigosozonata HHB-11173 SS5]|uniref:uncharacterized protein n=1 Tax=Punctularia strigosozonata (strain HHB-11173) TaxID=741275 RepID=UPI000441718F